MLSIETSFEVKRIFDNEVREKKKTGRGIYKKTGSRGYVGRMLTTMDYLKGKEKREYIKSGDLKMSNVYKQLLPYEDLITYTPESQKNILEQWREIYSQRDIVNALGVNKNIYYKKLYDLNVLDKPKKREERKEDGTKKEEARKENILGYKEFRSLPKEEQYYLLDYYFSRYDTATISSIWNRKKTSIHQFRYTLKKYMKDNNLSLDDTKKMKSIIENWNDILEARKSHKSNVKVEYVEADEEEKEEKPVVNNLMNLYGEDKKKKQEQKNGEASNWGDYEAKEEHHGELDAVKQEVAEMIASKDKQINDLIKKNELLISKFEIDKENAFREGELAESNRRRKDELDALHYGIDKVRNVGESDVPVVPEVVEEAIKPSGMSFNYVEQQEGFIVHTDIKRFIAMLEKNPDTFKVEMKITRIDGND